MSNNFHKYLDQQLKFIENTCRLYDEGDSEESVRLAAVFRVLFHTSSKSTSLLTHLGQTGRKMLSTNGSLGTPLDPSKPLTFFHGLTSLCIVHSEKKTRTWYEPRLGNGKMIHFAKWWNVEPIFEIGGTPITRRKLVLVAANQDGGAHVDNRLDPKYEKISLGEEGLKLITTPDTNTVKITIQPISQIVLEDGETLHIASFGAAAALRQIAYETLISFGRLSPLPPFTLPPQ